MPQGEISVEGFFRDNDHKVQSFIFADQTILLSDLDQMVTEVNKQISNPFKTRTLTQNLRSLAATNQEVQSLVSAMSTFGSLDGGKNELAMDNESLLAKPILMTSNM